MEISGVSAASGGQFQPQSSNDKIQKDLDEYFLHPTKENYNTIMGEINASSPVSSLLQEHQGFVNERAGFEEMLKTPGTDTDYYEKQIDIVNKVIGSVEQNIKDFRNAGM